MENKSFMTVEEVANELGVSKSYAYKVVRELNTELQKLGYLTVSGRVNTNFLPKKALVIANRLIISDIQRKGDDVMAVYKDGDKWRVIYRYTNYRGERKQTQKRGFATKREAQAWEREVMLKSESKLDMTFASFFEIYEADKKNG